MITLHERDLWGPHRGMRVQVTELHGVMGEYEHKIVREPFWMEIHPENVAIAQARAERFKR